MKVLVTGSSGTIGTILLEGLTHSKTLFDLPTHDVRRYDQLLQCVAGHDAVVHLAWSTKDDNCVSDFHNPDNALQVFNVYKAAVEAGLLDPYALPVPDSPYGAGKCFMEALGRYYADQKGLEVICVRFGGVNRKNAAPAGSASGRQVWLSHGDCVRLIQQCLDAPAISGNYAIIYAVSDNEGRVHDITNPVGWVPKDGAR